MDSIGFGWTRSPIRHSAIRRCLTHAGIRLDQYGNTSEPPFAGARLLSRFNVHCSSTPGQPAPCSRPCHPNHPTIQPSNHPPIHQSTPRHPSRVTLLICQRTRQNPLPGSWPRLTPAIKPHSQKKLIPPEGETRTFLKKSKNSQSYCKQRKKL